jgi:hypothetical protein
LFAAGRICAGTSTLSSQRASIDKPFPRADAFFVKRNFRSGSLCRREEQGMIIYYGEDGPARAKKVECLGKFFGDLTYRPASQLADGELAEKTSWLKQPVKGESIIISAHGNTHYFSGQNHQTLLKTLTDKGLNVNGVRFSKIYLMACLVGAQAQDGSITSNFARNFHQLLRNDGSKISVYAPRGLLVYDYIVRTADGLQFFDKVKAYVQCPERAYTLDEGIVLVN